MNALAGTREGVGRAARGSGGRAGAPVEAAAADAPAAGAAPAAGHTRPEAAR